MNCEKDFENILYEIQDGILYLTLNRPEARNALTPAMWRDIRSAVEMARTNDSIKGTRPLPAAPTSGKSTIVITCRCCTAPPLLL